MPYIYAVKYPKFSDFTWTVIITLPILTYIHLRGYLLALTYDECWTFLGYAQGDIWSTITNRHPAANNHVFHSLLVTVSQWLIGDSEYAIRLPSLLAFIPFTYFLIQILRTLTPRNWLLGLAFILYQPYLLDYFVAARGYSIALAMMLGAIWSMMQFLDTRDQKKLLMATILAGLAAYTNFTFILFLAVFIFVSAVVVIRKKWPMQSKTKLGIFLILTTTFALIAIPLKKLVTAEELYYGGVSDFFHDTMMSMAFSIQYQSGYALPLAILLSALPFYLGFKLMRTRENEGLVLIWTTGVLIAISSIAQHFILGTPYLIDRTALILLPYFLLFLLILTDSLKPKAGKLGAILLVLLAVTNSAAHMNFTHLVDFREYADVRSAMELIQADQPSSSYSLGKSVYLNAPINYYAKQFKMTDLEQSDLAFCEDGPFVLLFESDTECLEERPYELVEKYPVSGLHLYRHKEENPSIR